VLPLCLAGATMDGDGPGLCLRYEAGKKKRHKEG
jgi:hypothetical protein